MSETVMEQKTVVVPFGKRNANRERIEREEAELKKLNEENVARSGQSEENVDNEEQNDSNLSAEEKSFKKRYGDLRRHSQQQALSLQKQIDELKQQLTQSTEQQIKLPTSEDELATWAKTYPDVAKIVETIAIKKAKEQTAALDERFRALDERDKLTAREKAELELLKIHPDFDTIRDTDDFHNWAEEQPEWVQKALYENDTDARSAARAIDLYKIDRNIGKAKPEKKTSGAAESVNTRGSRSTPVSQDTDGVIYESQVAKMSSLQYEKNVEAIQKAMQTGKFVYDLSGNAR
jgi:DNA repair exonuclease SbcCD ATPase subunit